MTPTNFFASTDLIVIGTNPEMADISNPRGNIIGYAAYVYADDGITGDRRRMFVKSDRWEQEVLPDAERLAKSLNAQLDSGDIPDTDSWQDTRPIYGSDAYIKYGQEDDLTLEMNEEMW